MNWTSRSARLTAAVLVCVAVGATSPASADSPHLTDTADDAYRVPETPLGQPEPRPAMPLLSNDTADVLSATLSAARPTEPGHDGAYKLSLTLAGTPEPNFNYIVGAQFGPDCTLIHFLTPGQTRRAVATCGEGDKARSAGFINGSAATVRGQTVSATFSFRKFRLPGHLKTSRSLGPFWVLACPSRGTDKWACESDDLLDFAYSEGTFEL